MVYSSGVWARSLAWMAAWCVPTIRSCPSFRWPGRGQKSQGHRSNPWVLASNLGKSQVFGAFRWEQRQSQSWGSRIPSPSAQFQLKKRSQSNQCWSCQLNFVLRFARCKRYIPSLWAWNAWWVWELSSVLDGRGCLNGELVWKPVGHCFNGRPPHQPFDETHFSQFLWTNSMELASAPTRDSERYVSPCWILHFIQIRSINK